MTAYVLKVGFTSPTNSPYVIYPFLNNSIIHSPAPISIFN